MNLVILILIFNTEIILQNKMSLFFFISLKKYFSIFITIKTYSKNIVS